MSLLTPNAVPYGYTPGQGTYYSLITGLDDLNLDVKAYCKGAQTPVAYPPVVEPLRNWLPPCMLLNMVKRRQKLLINIIPGTAQEVCL